MGNKSILVIGITLLVLLILAGSGYFYYRNYYQVSTMNISPTPTPYSGPPEKIILGNFTGVYSLPNLIAVEKGFFKEYGLDPEVKEYISAPEELKALIAGQINVGIASDFTGVSYIYTNPELRILSQISKQNVFRIIARTDKGISSPADLKGKRIGVTSKSVGEFFLGEFLTANSITTKDVKIVNLPIADSVKQIESGQIDAAVVFDPFAYDLKQKLGSKVLLWSAQGEQKVYALSYTTKPYIDAHPEIIKRYLQVLVKSEDYIKTHDAEVRAYIAKKFGYKEDYINYILSNINFNLSLDQELLLNMEAQSRFSIDNKLTTQTTTPNYLNSIYFDGLTAVKPEAVTIIR